MAYLSDTATTFASGAAAATALTMPVHVANDVLVVFASQGQNQAFTLGGTGWTQIGTTTNVSTLLCYAVWYKKAASSAEAPTITTVNGYFVWVFCISDVDTTTQIDVSNLTADATSISEISSTAITTTTPDCFVLYCVAMDGFSAMAHSDPGVMFIGSRSNGAAGATTGASSGAAWYHQTVAGATPTPSWTKSINTVSGKLSIAFRNKIGGRIPAYIDDVSSPGSKLIVGHHFSTLNGISFPTSSSLTNIGPEGAGKAVIFRQAAATANYGINPFAAALTFVPTATATTSAQGFQVDFAASKDFTTGFVMGTLIANSPRDASTILGSISQGGFWAVIADASNNYRSYQVVARDSVPNAEGRIPFSIQCNQSTTAYGTSGAINVAAITKMQFDANNPTASVTLHVAEVYLVKTQIIAGGDATFPVSVEDIGNIGKSFRISTIQKVGASGLLAFTGIQVGGGDAVNFQLDGSALQFPRIYSTSKKEINFHSAANSIGISYAGKTLATATTAGAFIVGNSYKILTVGTTDFTLIGASANTIGVKFTATGVGTGTGTATLNDVIKHTNSVIASPSPYYWNINASATADCTWDFAGLTIIGANVSLRNVTTFDSMVFSSCPTIDATGCTVNACTFSRLPATNNTLTLSSTSVLSSCVINSTGITAGNYWTTVTTLTIFSGCVFTGSTTSGHAIRITTPGTYAFVGNQFNGYGANASTSAAIFNDSGGLVTINVTGGGGTPTVRNGAGASFVVNNSKALTLTGLQNLSDIVILTAGTSTSLINIDQNVGATYIYSYNTSSTVDIGVFKSGYVPFYIRNFVLPTTDSSLPIVQVVDRNYV